jgi:hypothetical protein
MRGVLKSRNVFFADHIFRRIGFSNNLNVTDEINNPIIDAVIEF